MAVGGAGPVPHAEDLFAGWWQLIEALGAVPRALVWDGEGAIGRWRAGKPELTGECQAFRGTLGTRVVVCKPADPEAKGLIERATTTWSARSCPAATSPSPADFNAQLQQWLAVVNTRTRRALGCAPADRIAADRAAMLALPPVAPATGWRASARLARDHYVRLDSNDYSVHPAVIGRRIEVIADLDRVRVALRRAGRRRPRAGLGLAPDHHRPRARRRGEGAAPRAGRRAAAGRPSPRSSSAAWPSTTPRWASTRRRGARDGRRQGPREDGRDLTAEIAFLTRALKAPTLRESVDRLAERARAESWSHEEFLVACLQREVAARESHGGEGRIRAARFPARKSLEEFDFDHARGLKRDLIAHLGTLDFVTGQDNIVFLGPPGTGKTHLATGWRSAPARPGTGSCSPPPPTGSPDSPTPTTPASSRTNSSAWAATRCWSSTRSATSPSSPRPPTCSSTRLAPATNAPR